MQGRCCFCSKTLRWVGQPRDVMTRDELVKKYQMDDNWSVLLNDGKTTIKGLFADQRIPNEDVPAGMYKYDLREDDTLYCPATIEKRVVVNFYGTFITDEPLDFGGKDYIELDTDYCETDVMLWGFGYSESDLEGCSIVTWPDSQKVSDIKGFYAVANLIDDKEGLDKYGMQAYVVPDWWLEENNVTL